MTCDLSVVIPAYNEARTIAVTLETVARYLTANGWAWEILVVNDGSRDATAAAVRAAQGLGPRQIRLLEHPRNLGKGAAVRTGVLASTGQAVLLYDADGATPITELAKCRLPLQQGADLVVGSRRMAGASVRRSQPWIRRLLGAGYVWLANALTGVRVSDITCGFKALRGEAARAIFARMQVAGWSFDAELLYLARRLRCRIVEVPVTWTHQPDTKVRLSRDVLTSLADLVRIRWRAFQGAYRSP